MSLLMNQVVQAQCPGCKKSLKIPANWIHEPMKCKQCGLVFQAKPPQTKKGFFGRALPSGTDKGRKKETSPLASKPFAPPPGLAPAKPAAVPVAMPAMPVATPAIPTAAVAMPGAIRADVPMAAAIPVGLQEGGKPPVSFRRRSRGGWQKLAFVLVFFLGVGGLAAVAYQNVPGLDLPNFAAGTAGESDTTPASPTVKGATAPGGKTEPTLTPTTKAKSTRLLFEQPITTKLVTRVTSIRPTEPLITRPVDPRPMETRPVGTKPDDPIKKDPPITEPAPVGVPNGSFPRRLLVVSVNNYPYMSPVNYGAGDRSLDRVVRQFAVLMRVPDDQVSLLSDKAPLPFPPVKEVVKQVIADYLANSRAQDRVMLMFVGHCIEVEDEPYLVPLEGDPEGKDKKENLIALDWLYQELAKCPAQQKVLILDVCRSDPAQGELRGKVAPMGEKTDAMLQKPPKGVQVLTACTAGQKSLEMDNRTTSQGLVDGGIFLNQIPSIYKDGGLRGIVQKPDDPLPIEELTRKVGAGTRAMAKSFFRPLKKDDPEIAQTPRLVGEVMKELAFDAKAKTPGTVKPKLPEIFKNGVAGRDDLLAMLKVTTQVPPVKQADKLNAFRVESLPPYPKDVMKDYKDDGKESPFRVAVMDGVKALQDSDRTFKINENFAAPPNEQVKTQINQQIENLQRNVVGEAMLVVRKPREELEDDSFKLARDKETKLWQANYDYVLARLYAREAYILEYSAKQGEIRRDLLPQRDTAIHKGWILAAKQDMSDKDGNEYVKEAKKIYKKMAEEHKGTPWELISKREDKTALGLEWRAN